MKHIKAYDALRGLCIISILISHLGLYHILPDNDFLKERVWLVISGWAGITIFFTLSGFLITLLLFSDQSQSRFVRIKNFYMRRIIRIFPPLIIFQTTIAILIHYNLIESTALGYYFSVFFLYNFAPINHYTMELGHTWTLALEEQFYLVWPFIIYYIPKKTHLIITLFFLVSLCVAAFYIYPHLEIIKRFRSIRWFLPAVAPILIGSYFAILHHFNFKKIKQLMTSTQWPLVFSGILFLFPLYSPGLTLTLFFQASGSALFLLWILHNQSSSTVRFLEFKSLVYVGKISYGLYIYHSLFIKIAGTSEHWFQVFPQNIFIVFGIAIISYEIMEKPILKLKRFFRNSQIKNPNKLPQFNENIKDY